MIPFGSEFVGVVISVMSWSVVVLITPTAEAPVPGTDSVNQIVLPGPTVIPAGICMPPELGRLTQAEIGVWLVGLKTPIAPGDVKPQVAA